MKRIVISVILIIALASIANAQDKVGLAAPEVIFQPLPMQFASVIPQPNAQYEWTISGGKIMGRTDRSLVVFSPSAPANASVVLSVRVTTPMGTQTARAEMPVIAPARPLADGRVRARGRRGFPILQLVRGERLLLTASPAIPLVLYDIQGRRIAAGNGRIDTRVPVRGSYLLVANTNSTYQLNASGLHPFLKDEPKEEQLEKNDNFQGMGTPVVAKTGTLSGTALVEPRPTYGESLIRVGNGFVATWYDAVAEASVIMRFNKAGQPEWRWQSQQADSLYLRTLAAEPEGGVVGIGSCGEAGPADQICVLRLSSTGSFQWLTRLATSGYDYGYGIAANKNGVFVGGFTSGAFPGTTNQGKLDGFAAALDPRGKVAWLRQFGSAGNDRVFALSADDKGTTLFGDTSGSWGTFDSALGSGGSRDLFLTRFSLDGSLIFSKRYGSDQPDLAFDIRTDTDGKHYTTGMTRGLMAGNTSPSTMPQVFLIQFQADGSPGWRTQLGPREGSSAEVLDLIGDRLNLLFYTNGSFSGAQNNSFGTRGSDDMVVATFSTTGTLRRVTQYEDTSERIFARGLAQVGSDLFVLRDRVYRPGEPFSTISIDKLRTEP